jgi:hypothetical protein
MINPEMRSGWRRASCSAEGPPSEIAATNDLVDVEGVEQGCVRVGLGGGGSVLGQAGVQVAEPRRGDQPEALADEHAAGQQPLVVAAAVAVHDEHWRPRAGLGVLDGPGGRLDDAAAGEDLGTHAVHRGAVTRIRRGEEHHEHDQHGERQEVAQPQAPPGILRRCRPGAERTGSGGGVSAAPHGQGSLRSLAMYLSISLDGRSAVSAMRLLRSDGWLALLADGLAPRAPSTSKR